MSTRSSELELLLWRAAFIGQKEDLPTVSYTSIFLALLHDAGPWSRWAQQTAQRTGVTLERVLERWKQTGGMPAHFTRERLKVSEFPDSFEFTRSPSADRLLASAVTNRDLIGAYIYGSEREDDLRAWGLRRERWAVLFYPRLEREFPEERSRYLDLHKRYHRPASVGIREALAWAGGLAPDKPISARDVVRGILSDGAHYADEGRYTSSWFFRELGAPVESSRPARPGALHLDPSAQDLLDGAALFATCSRDQEVHVTHLLLAALCWDKFPAPELLRGRQRVSNLLAKLLDFIAARGTDEVPQLREMVGLVRSVRTLDEREVVLNSDSVGSSLSLDEDALGIRDDVRAMAAVLASSSLKPPLSVGLFGDWGSGKSFFMGLLRRRIADLASASREARQSNRKTSFHGDIIQIEFNAWQYMDANLWASIVAHIFDQLSAALRERDKPPATKYLAELTSIREEQEALVRQKAKLNGEITGVRAQIEKLEGERKQKQLPWTDMGKEILRLRDEDPGVKQGLDDLARSLGVDRATLTVEEARRLWQSAGTIGGWAKSIRRSPRKLLYVLIPVLLPSALLLVPQRPPAWVPLLMGALVLARQIITLAGAGYQAFSRAMERVDAAERQAREKLSEEEKLARAEEARIDAEEQKLEQRRAELSRRREELENKLAELKEAASYKRFVLDRAASSDYRSQLGLITTIHRDLKTLSEKLKTSEEPHVDRIILYIDDLDRCPPDRVVEVLQAVHLILSLELFVVVVAVDSRWLLQSLEAYYRRHFGERRQRRTSDPQHYLEKIFQIPYAISPMTEPGFGSLVRSLLGQSVVKERVIRADTEDPIRVRVPAGDRDPAKPAQRVAADDPASNLTPRSLEITEDELTNLQKLGRLLGSPRSVKRMVNLYRIVRAGLDEDLIDEFVQGGYKLHQLLLAAVVGAPKEAAVLFDEIFEGRITNREQLAEYLSAQGGSLERAFASQDCFNDWRAVVEAARSAGRFSFQTGRVLQGVP